MDIYEEAAQSYRNDCEEADRERSHALNEARYEPHYIVKDMMGSTYHNYFHTDAVDEQHEKHVYDARRGF